MAPPTTRTAYRPTPMPEELEPEEPEEEEALALLGAGSPGWKRKHVSVIFSSPVLLGIGNDRCVREREEAYHALQIPNQHPIQQFTRFIAVTDIFEGFCCVLAADVEEDFFTTTATISIHHL